MTTWILRACLVLSVVVASGCGAAEPQTSTAAHEDPEDGVAEPDPQSGVAPPSQPIEPTDDDLRAFLAPAFDPGNGRALALAARPTPEDFDAVFLPAAAATGREALIPLFDSPEAEISPMSETRTEILIRSATTEELAAGSDAADELPGGMAMVAEHLRPGIRWYHVKFVEPGATSGLSLTAFVYTSGRWVWFPKPWRFLR